MFDKFDTDFDKHFTETQGMVKKAFGVTVVLGIIGAVMSMALIGAVIYLIVKVAGSL